VYFFNQKALIIEIYNYANVKQFVFGTLTYDQIKKKEETLKVFYFFKRDKN
jgi:hypothetical protein